MWYLAASATTGSQSAPTGNNALELLFYLTAIVASIVTISLALRSIVSKVIERSKEEALEKQKTTDAMESNTRAIEKLDTSTSNLAEQLAHFSADVAERLSAISNRVDRLERATDGNR